MGWERRARGGLYYTRSRREGRRVVREYVGRGDMAEYSAELDAMERAAREYDLALVREERAAARGIPDAISAFSVDLESLVTITLEEAGYHEHRGQWRRRRA